MQADQQQKLAQLIKTSQVLRQDERQAWLAMLPVMNDKQAGDLFGILNTPVTNKTIQLGNLNQNDKQPSLRHISNLPTEMSYHIDSGDKPSQQSAAQPVAVNRKPVSKPQAPRPIAPHPDMAQVIKQRLEEKELPAPDDAEPLELTSGHEQVKKSQARLAQAEDSEVQLMRKKISGPRAATILPASKLQQQTNEYIPLDDLLKERKQREGQRQAVKVATEPKPVSTNPSADPSQEIKDLDDIASCSLATLENQGYESLNDQLMKLVRKHGYFAVILRFESSPLYIQYLEAGKTWLSLNPTEEAQTAFPKAEFEKVTDMLRNMQLA